MKAKLSNYRQAPRKVRLIADLIRGKSVDRALTELTAVHKRAAEPFRKLILSAVANAEQTRGSDRARLFLKEVRVDEGVMFTRYLPRAYGRVTPLNRRASHVSVVLGEQQKESGSRNEESSKTRDALNS